MIDGPPSLVPRLPPAGRPHGDRQCAWLSDTSLGRVSCTCAVKEHCVQLQGRWGCAGALNTCIGRIRGFAGGGIMFTIGAPSGAEAFGTASAFGGLRVAIAIAPRAAGDGKRTRSAAERRTVWHASSRP